MLSRFRWYSLLVLLVFTSGCALSPQLVAVKPDLKVAVANYGQQRDINVRVADRRSNPVIGTRGGIYGETSTIEIGNNHLNEIAYAVAGGLTRWGFRSTVDGYRGHALEFNVSLDNLRYQPDRSVAGKLVITADFSIVVENGSYAYQGKYSASEELMYATSPSEEKNNAEINKVLSLALEKIFADDGLVKFLQ
jgi:uncharacterized lipoprotein